MYNDHIMYFIEWSDILDYDITFLRVLSQKYSIKDIYII